MLQIGDRGIPVKDLQKALTKLGYEPVEVDGVFGPVTRWAVCNLQAMFGYVIDGVVGENTERLFKAQISYGWHTRSVKAQRVALRTQGLVDPPPLDKEDRLRQENKRLQKEHEELRMQVIDMEKLRTENKKLKTEFNALALKSVQVGEQRTLEINKLEHDVEALHQLVNRVQRDLDLVQGLMK